MAAAVAMQPSAYQTSPPSAHVPRSPTNSHMHVKPVRASLKQLNSGDGQRVRKERPCDGCRRRKSKCVIQDTVPCVLCRFHKQDCTFLEAALPRKRKADDSLNKDDAFAKSTKIRHDSAQASEPPSAKLAATGRRPYAPETVRRGNAELLDNTLSLQRHRHCRHIGSSSAFDTSLLGLCSFDHRKEASLAFGDIRRVSKSSFFDMIPDSTFQNHDQELQSLYQVEQIVAPHGPALIDLFFKNVHPSFPIIQKNVFLDRHRHGDRQIHSALLAGMYVLALRWWSSEPSLALYAIPSIEALEKVGFRCLSTAMQRPKLSALQAGLLLLQRQPSNAWNLIIQLVALAQDLGLHLDCTTWAIPLWERRLRKRLAWAVYMQDKWSGLIHGRPSHIQVTDWSVPALTSQDFDEEVLDEDNNTDNIIDDDAAAAETDKGQGHSLIFTQMIELTGIMAEVIETFYTQRAMTDFDRAGPKATALILAKAKPVQLKLKEWFASLPAEARMDNYSPGEHSSNGSLHLAYFATEISIHRRIVQSLSTSGSPDPYMLYICRSAAKTRLISAMDFVNRLRPEHLDSSWHFASTTNFALIATFGNLLRATAPGEEEARFYESRLKEYRWALSVSSRRAEWIQGAIGILDSTNDMLENLPEKPSSGK